MRALEIVVALIVAAVAFVAVKLLGLVIHIALIAAVLGLVVGFAIARAFRRT
jgi:positive regulator of sigma E activity